MPKLSPVKYVIPRSSLTGAERHKHDFKESQFPGKYTSVSGKAFLEHISGVNNEIPGPPLLKHFSTPLQFASFLDLERVSQFVTDDCLDSSIELQRMIRALKFDSSIATNCPFEVLGKLELRAVKQIHFFNIVNVSGKLYIVDLSAEQFAGVPVSPVVLPWDFAALHYEECRMYFTKLPGADHIAFALLDLNKWKYFPPLLSHSWF